MRMPKGPRGRGILCLDQIMPLSRLWCPVVAYRCLLGDTRCHVCWASILFPVIFCESTISSDAKFN